MDAAYYLVHSMGSAQQFAQRDREAASLFSKAAGESGVGRIVYLGGLGDDRAALSRHLASRHEVGVVLRSGGVEVIEFRAAMIIGSGSISFEMMRYLTERLPVMIAPRWVITRCQPIAITDVLRYLVTALDLPHGESHIYGNWWRGRRDLPRYDATLCKAAQSQTQGDNRTAFYAAPLLLLGASRNPDLGKHRSASHPRPAQRSDRAQRRGAPGFPQITPLGFDEAVSRALDRYRTTGPETTWFDAFDVRRLPATFSGAREGMLIDRRQCIANASPKQVASVFMQLGGKRGWLSGDRLWKLRGLMDRAVGGIGLRRGRRSETDLRLGDAVNLWRVDALTPERLLRLRAEMKLPGNAWLEIRSATVRWRAYPPHADGVLRAARTVRFSLLVSRLAAARAYFWPDGVADCDAGHTAPRANGEP